MEQHSFRWFLGNQRPFHHCIHFLFPVVSKKGRKRCASSPLCDWLFVGVLVLLPIFDLLLAALAPPDRVLEIIAVAFDHVNVSSVDHLLSGCDIATVTASKPHQRLNASCSKDWWHRIFLLKPAHQFTPVLTAT
jgi:hypothetical protein